MFYHDTRFNPSRVNCMGKPEDDLHKLRHFNICRAINITSLSCVLADMVADAHLSKNQADIFMAQARCLLSTILTENNRSLGF